VLTAQTGITVSTFHGWFLPLVQRAPLSAGGAMRRWRSRLHRCWKKPGKLLPKPCRANPDSDATRCMNELFRDYGLSNTKSLLLGFVHRRAEWWAYTQGASDPLALAAARLRSELNVDPIKIFSASCAATPCLLQSCANIADCWNKIPTRTKVLLSGLRQTLKPATRKSGLKPLCRGVYHCGHPAQTFCQRCTGQTPGRGRRGSLAGAACDIG